MSVKLVFRLLDRQHLITNILGMTIDVNAGGRFTWERYGMSQKVISWGNPLAKGTGSYQIGRADLLTTDNELYGRLIYPTELRNLDRDNEGLFIDNRLNQWAAFFVARGIAGAHDANALLRLLA